jgi:hypothetical protein
MHTQHCYLGVNFFVLLVVIGPYMLCMHVPSSFHLPLIIVLQFVMHDRVWRIESDVRGWGRDQTSFHLHMVGHF